jgi:hypothetical protein
MVHTNNLLFYFSKIASPNRNTLDSFVIKKAPRKYFHDRVLKNETNETVSHKRTQRAIDDYVYKDIKPSAKRFKK